MGFQLLKGGGVILYPQQSKIRVLSNNKAGSDYNSYHYKDIKAGQVK